MNLLFLQQSGINDGVTVHIPLPSLLQLGIFVIGVAVGLAINQIFTERRVNQMRDRMHKRLEEKNAEIETLQNELNGR